MKLYLFAAALILAMPVLSAGAAQPTKPVDHVPPAQKSYDETLKQQELFQRLRWQLEASKIKAEDYKYKTEMARSLSEAIKTGLVDADGNIIGKGVAATFVPPNKETTEEHAELQTLPALSSIQGKWAYFSTSKGLLRAKAGSLLPGDYRLKAIQVGRVVLEQQGTEYVVSLNWTKLRKNKEDSPLPRAGNADTGMDFLKLPAFLTPTGSVTGGTPKRSGENTGENTSAEESEIEIR